MRLSAKISPRPPRVARAAAVAVLAAGVLAAGVLAGDGHTLGAAAQTAGARPSAGTAASLAAASRRGLIVIGNKPGQTTAQAGSMPPIDLSAYQLCASDSTYAGSANVDGPFSALLAGWSDASKLGGALTVGYPTPALAQSANGGHIQNASPIQANGDQWNCFKIQADLDYQGRREFPPTTATFLGFGFVPVTATVHLIQAGPVTAVIYQPIATDNVATPLGSTSPMTAVSTAQVSVQVTNVKVNGVPLDVGNNCHTDGILTSPGNPINYNGLVLQGGVPAGSPGPRYDFGFSGALAGTAEIPPFTGCVTPDGDNLDPLLTSSVSGPGNEVQIDQATPCFYLGTAEPSQCAVPLPSVSSPPGVPTDLPYWTVTSASPNTTTYTAKSPVTIWTFIRVPPGTRIGCNSAFTLTVGDTTGPPRGDTGTADWSFTDCHDQKGNSWTVTTQGDMPIDAEFVGHGQPAGVTTFELWSLALNLTEDTSGGCTMEIGGDAEPIYADGTLSIPSVAAEVAGFDKANCTPSFAAAARLAGGAAGNPPGGNPNPDAPISFQFSPSFKISSP
jgi:hypothetical protein